VTTRLTTEFDVPVGAVPVPLTLSRGDDPALRLVDGLVRGVTLPGRFQRSPALFGLKVEPTTDRTGVTITFGADATSDTWWKDRAAVPEGSRAGSRLLTVRAQGRPRGAVLLPGARTEPKTVSLSFELGADELDPDGLLVIEAGAPSGPMPDWLTAATTPYPAIGLTIVKAELTGGGATPIAPAATATMSSGLFLVEPSWIDSAPAWRLRLDTGSGSESPASGGSGQARSGFAVGLPPAPNVGSQIPHGRPLPPPGPRYRVGRWMAGLRARAAAESRLDGQGKDLRGERPELEVSGSATSTRPASRPGASAFPEATVVAGLLADLVRERRLRVRLAGLYSGAEQTLPVKLLRDGELEVAAPGPLREPSVIRVDAAEDELFSAPELRRPGVAWHLIG
jgi:hypothetical protein